MLETKTLIDPLTGQPVTVTVLQSGFRVEVRVMTDPLSGVTSAVTLVLPILS